MPWDGFIATTREVKSGALPAVFTDAAKFKEAQTASRKKSKSLSLWGKRRSGGEGADRRRRAVVQRLPPVVPPEAVADRCFSKQPRSRRGFLLALSGVTVECVPGYKRCKGSCRWSALSSSWGLPPAAPQDKAMKSAGNTWPRPVVSRLSHGKQAGSRCLCRRTGPADAFWHILWPEHHPHPQSGIGRWSEADFIRAIRRGERPDGSTTSRFPYPSFTLILDNDLSDLWAYLRTLPPSARGNQDHALQFPFGWRFPVLFWKWFFFTPGPFVPDPQTTPVVSRGAYLVLALGHCGECHTPRNFLGGPKRDRLFAGGTGPDGKHIPNLTPTRLMKWSFADLKNFLLTGLTPDGDVTAATMAEVVRNTTSQLTAEDLTAVIEYLRTLPPLADEPADLSRRYESSVLDEKTQAAIESFQQAEITEFHIYSALAAREKNAANSRVLARIGEDEKRHYDFWKKYSGSEVRPNRLKVYFFCWVSWIFGLTFGIKLMEMGEERAQGNYGRLAAAIPEAAKIAEEEGDHERELIGMIDDRAAPIHRGHRPWPERCTGRADRGARRVHLCPAEHEDHRRHRPDHRDRRVLLHGFLGVPRTGVRGRHPESPQIFALHLRRLSVHRVAPRPPLLPVRELFRCPCLRRRQCDSHHPLVQLLRFRCQGPALLEAVLEMTAISLGVATVSFGIGYFVRVWLGVDV